MSNKFDIPISTFQEYKKVKKREGFVKLPVWTFKFI